MESNDAHRIGGNVRDDALVEALVAPGEGSFVDALLALAGEAGDGRADGGQRMLSNALQAALARKMRAILAHEDDARDAA